MLRCRWSGRSASLAVAVIAAAVLVTGALGDARSAGAKPSGLTAAERANSGVVTYDQIADSSPECGGEAGARETVHFEHVFSGSKSVKITSLDVPDDAGNVYKRKKKNVWTRVSDEGVRVVIKFRRDGMTLQSFNPDGSRCIKYSRTLVEPTG